MSTQRRTNCTKQVSLHVERHATVHGGANGGTFTNHTSSVYQYQGTSPPEDLFGHRTHLLAQHDSIHLSDGPAIPGSFGQYPAPVYPALQPRSQDTGSTLRGGARMIAPPPRSSSTALIPVRAAGSSRELVRKGLTVLEEEEQDDDVAPHKRRIVEQPSPQQEEELAKARDECREKERVVKQLNGRIERRDREIAKMKESYAMYGQQIQTLTDGEVARDNEIQRLKSVEETRNRELIEMRKQVRVLMLRF